MPVEDPDPSRMKPVFAREPMLIPHRPVQRAPVMAGWYGGAADGKGNIVAHLTGRHTAGTAARGLGCLCVASVAVAACSTSGGNAAVTSAQKHVSHAQNALSDAQSDLAAKTAEFCTSARSYIVALDRYGDVLHETALADAKAELAAVKATGSGHSPAPAGPTSSRGHRRASWTKYGRRRQGPAEGQRPSGHRDGRQGDERGTAGRPASYGRGGGAGNVG